MRGQSDNAEKATRVRNVTALRMRDDIDIAAADLERFGHRAQIFKCGT
jgi:hypothetical protein